MTLANAMRETGAVPRRIPRAPDPDAWAAWRITYERERYGWSQPELARLVSEAGAPIRQQTISEIENREPPRRISLGEAIAFCKVFGIADVADLGKPPAGTLSAEIARAEENLNQVIAAGERFRSIERQLSASWARLKRAEQHDLIDWKEGHIRQIVQAARQLSEMLSKAAGWADVDEFFREGGRPDGDES